MKSVSSLFLTLSLVVTGAVGAAAQPLRDEPPARLPLGVGDNILHSRSARQFNDRQQALAEKLRGGDTAGRVGQGQRYVELEQIREDRIFVVIAEFGTTSHPSYPGGTAGPLHNEIARPERDDNVTIWQADYNSDHYRTMYFDRMLDYYRIQSSGRYGFGGAVTEWVKVPYNEARYGRNSCGSSVCSNVWNLLSDAVSAWHADQLAQGKSPTEIRDYLKTFDIWDRYDYDNDGNFNEPDGYIDHFQIVHAGVGEETGGGAQLQDAIWSHRWFAFRQPARRGRSHRQPGRRNADRQQRHLGWRLHHSTRERRARRVRARVRPRSRSPRPLRHRGRRQLDRLLDHHVRRQLRWQRQAGHRRSSGRLRRLGEVATGLAERRYLGRLAAIDPAPSRSVRVQYRRRPGAVGAAARPASGSSSLATRPRAIRRGGAAAATTSITRWCARSRCRTRRRCSP